MLPPYVKPTLIAHRGASAYAPEHTLEAYRLALEQGADFVEPDLQITKDGALICMHDASLERTTDVSRVYPARARMVKGKKTWQVSDFTLAEIEKLDAGSWFGERFRGARVPTLQRMIDAVKGKAGIIPETKSPDAYGELGLDMEKLLMEVLTRNGLDKPGAHPKTPVIIQSFSAESLRRLHKNHGCKLPLVFLMDKDAAKTHSTKEGLAKLRSFAAGIGPAKDVVLARPKLVRDAHVAGLSVTVWTFRSKNTGKFTSVAAEMRHFLNDLSVDAVFTDNPDQFPRTADCDTSDTEAGDLVGGPEGPEPGFSHSTQRTRTPTDNRARNRPPPAAGAPPSR